MLAPGLSRRWPLSAPDQLLRTVAERIRLAGGLPTGCRLLVACSGGADSTALLDSLRRLGATSHWRLTVVHIDHCQGDHASQAAVLLAARCRRWRIPFLALGMQPDRFGPGASEDALRQERYRLLRQASRDHDQQRIALGHTASDQSETVLMRLLRGTAVGGLAGMPGLREGLYLRPLLDLTRTEVLAYLRTRRLRWCEDPTNRDTSKLRNLLRLELLPAIRERINPAVDQALLRLCACAAQDEEALQAWAATADLGEPGPGLVAVGLAELRSMPRAVQARVALRMVRSLIGPEGNLELTHQSRLLDRLEAGDSFRLGLQSGLQARTANGRLVLSRKSALESGAAGFEIEIESPGLFQLPQSGFRLEFRLLSRFRHSQAGPRRVFFDAEEVGFPLRLRSVRPGDQIQAWGGRGSRSVRRLFIKDKVPASLRLAVPLLLQAERILWVVGLRRSRWAPVTAASRSILSIECLDGAGPRP